jgi:hypothetical protein
MRGEGWQFFQINILATKNWKKKKKKKFWPDLIFNTVIIERLYFFIFHHIPIILDVLERA